MNENFVELLVKRKDNLAAKISRAVCIGFAVLFVLLTFATAITLFLFVALIFFGIAWVIQYNSEIEYEYLYLDKHLTIDRIKNKSKRKNVADYDLTGVEILAPASSHRLDSYTNNQGMKMVDYSTGMEGGQPYMMVIRSGNVCQKVLMEMNDELYEQIFRVAPRNVYKD